MNDYELVYLAQEQNEEALEYLYQKYDKLIKGLIFKRFFNLIKLGIDLNDVYNWCLNALNNAIKSYNADNNAIFLLTQLRLLKILSKITCEIIVKQMKN